MIVAGIGYRSGVTTKAIVALVERAMATIGATSIDVLAIPGFRSADGDKSKRAAETLMAEFICMEDQQLAFAADRCQTAMARAHPLLGQASIAEATALAAAGPISYLLLPRIKSGVVTCALAEGPS